MPCESMTTTHHHITASAPARDTSARKKWLELPSPAAWRRRRRRRGVHPQMRPPAALRGWASRLPAMRAGLQRRSAAAAAAVPACWKPWPRLWAPLGRHAPAWTAPPPWAAPAKAAGTAAATERLTTLLRLLRTRPRPRRTSPRLAAASSTAFSAPQTGRPSCPPRPAAGRAAQAQRVAARPPPYPLDRRRWRRPHLALAAWRPRSRSARRCVASLYVARPQHPVAVLPRF